MGMNKSTLSKLGVKHPEKNHTGPRIGLGPTGREDGQSTVTSLLKTLLWLPIALRQNRYKLFILKVPLQRSPSRISPCALWA